MRLKTYFNLILTFLIILSCTDKNEEINTNFSIHLKNESSIPLTYEGWKLNEKLIEETISNNSSYTINYKSVSFLGLFGNIDSLVFKFENNKGYICTGELTDNLYFENRNLFDEESFEDLGDNNFEFIISQEDFENAFDLPE